MTPDYWLTEDEIEILNGIIQNSCRAASEFESVMGRRIQQHIQKHLLPKIEWPEASLISEVKDKTIWAGGFEKLEEFIEGVEEELKKSFLRLQRFFQLFAACQIGVIKPQVISGAIIKRSPANSSDIVFTSDGHLDLYELLKSHSRNIYSCLNSHPEHLDDNQLKKLPEQQSQSFWLNRWQTESLSGRLMINFHQKVIRVLSIVASTDWTQIPEDLKAFIRLSAET
jgi:hypothetical protein